MAKKGGVCGKVVGVAKLWECLSKCRHPFVSWRGFVSQNMCVHVCVYLSLYPYGANYAESETVAR